MGKSGTIHMCHLNNYYSIRQRGTDWVNTGKPGPGQMMMSVCVKCNLDPSQASQKQILLHQTFEFMVVIPMGFSIGSIGFIFRGASGVM